MVTTKPTSEKIYFTAMAFFWFIFGAAATFYPAVFNIFLSEQGMNSVTAYSNHIWLHDGLDILSVSVLLFVLSREATSRNILKAAAIVALLVAVAMIYSLLTTSFWNILFLIPGLGCVAFSIWGLVLATKR
jgi:hypothetical protein